MITLCLLPILALFEIEEKNNFSDIWKILFSINNEKNVNKGSILSLKKILIILNYLSSLNTRSTEIAEYCE